MKAQNKIPRFSKDNLQCNVILCKKLYHPNKLSSSFKQKCTGNEHTPIRRNQRRQRRISYQKLAWLYICPCFRYCKSEEELLTFWWLVLSRRFIAFWTPTTSENSVETSRSCSCLRTACCTQNETSSQAFLLWYCSPSRAVHHGEFSDHCKGCLCIAAHTHMP